MRSFNKKSLYFEIQKGSYIGTILSALGMGIGSFLLKTDTTPLIVSSSTLLASLMGIIGSGTLSHVKEKRDLECEEFYNTIKVIEIIPRENKKQNVIHFYAVERAYEKKDNILSVDFEKISNIKRGKSLQYRKNTK